jgi:hypothetical protein
MPCVMQSTPAHVTRCGKGATNAPSLATAAVTTADVEAAAAVSLPPPLLPPPSSSPFPSNRTRVASCCGSSPFIHAEAWRAKPIKSGERRMHILSSRNVCQCCDVYYTIMIKREICVRVQCSVHCTTICIEVYVRTQAQHEMASQLLRHYVRVRTCCTETPLAFGCEAIPQPCLCRRARVVLDAETGEPPPLTVKGKRNIILEIKERHE